MKKSIAIKALNQQISKIEDGKEIFRESWFIHTRAYLRDIFGDDSNQYQYFFKEFHSFSGRYSDIVQNEEKLKSTINYINNYIIPFLQDCIDVVKIKGTHKPAKYNFLQNFNDAQLVGGIFAAAIVVFWIGVASAKWLGVSI